ncbi:hypothetical protein AK812_SmicGene32816 [Symbiodinium microadriaticum]|uniref:CCHC-type domain-containing protein n=1 Tax=Symbiodinium microadriaticum TaxID=2951 RepID=A0A1Q9CT59_SYMMI|nr:hypothetical protein AK812_SmicGene32816 [Symbiodinium microadriaticum]
MGVCTQLVDVSVLPLEPSPLQYHYRTKLTPHAQEPPPGRQRRARSGEGTFGKPLGRLAERACAEAAFRGNSSCENCAFVGVIVGGSEPSEPPGKAVNLLCEKGRRPIGAESYYDNFGEAAVNDWEGQSTPPPANRWRRWHSGTGGLSSGDRTSPGFSSGYESEEKSVEPRSTGWDGWAEDGSWKGTANEAFGARGPGKGWARQRPGFHENWSWRSGSGGGPASRTFGGETVDLEGSIRDSVDAPEEGENKGQVKIAGENAGERKGPGRVSNTYPPVFRARPQESYQEWKRGVEFWIGGEGLQLPVELIGPRMMVQLKDRAAQLVKHLTIKDVNGVNGKEVIFRELEKSPLIKQVDRHRVDEHRRRLMQLSRAAGESMESYVTRASVYRSHLLGVDESMAMGEAFYVGHLVDHARLTKRDRAMIKTKAGDMTDEGKVVAAMIELASELDGENGFPVGQSEPNLAKNGEEWLLQREPRGRVVSGQPGGKGARSVFVAEMDEVPGEDGEDLAEGPEDGGGELGPPELVYLEHEAFGTQYKARQKIAEVRKLRQYYQKPDTEEKKRWLSEQMKKNPCHACGQYGHWSRECPSKVQAALVTRSRSTAATSSPPPPAAEASEEAEWALLASLCSKGASVGHRGSKASGQYMKGSESLVVVNHALSTVSMSLHEVCWSLKALSFKVILDIGCMRSVVGVGWATEVIGRWREEGRWHRVEKEVEAFRFGDGEVLYSRYRVEFVGTFAGKEVVFGFSVVDGVCPPPVFAVGMHSVGHYHRLRASHFVVAEVGRQVVWDGAR